MTEELRETIRAEYATGRVSRSTLAARYAVSITSVDRAVKGIRRGPAARVWDDLPRTGRRAAPS